MQPPFHPYTEKKVGDRVKIPKFPLDESKGFYFGRVKRAGFLTDMGIAGVEVEWDKEIPFMHGGENFNCTWITA